MTVSTPTFDPGKQAGEPRKQTGIARTAARLFVTLAYRSFAATQCNDLPADPRAGIIAILDGDSMEKHHGAA